MSGYISTAEALGTAIDCRCLYLNLEFYDLPADKAASMGEDIIRWQAKLTEGFVVHRTCYDHVVSVDKALLDLKESVDGSYCFGMIQTGYVKSDVVYNKRSMKAYGREAMDSTVDNFVGERPPQYQTLWNELFPNGRESDEEICRKYYGIFQMPHKKLCHGYYFPDSDSLLILDPYKNDEKLFWGEYTFYICAYCLQDGTDAMAEYFREFLTELSNKYGNLNGRVMLQPYGSGKSPYTRYFDCNDNKDGSHEDAGRAAREWYQTYYLPGVEWFNIISPLVQERLAECPGGEKLPGGGLVLKSSKPITQYDVEDAVAMKKILLPVLPEIGIQLSVKETFDGFHQNTIKYYDRYLPRCDWAIVPILEDEIKIYWGTICFYKSKGDF